MTEKICVHLPTQEAYDTYMKWAEKKGWKRASLQKPTLRDVWWDVGSEFCVIYGNLFEYDYKSYYERKGYRIITLEEAMRMEEQKTTPTPEFVRGEVVEVKSCDEWVKATYYGTIEGERYPYIAKVKTNSGYSAWDHIRKLPKQEAGPKKFTREQVQKYAGKLKLGIMENAIANLLIKFCEDNGMLEE